MSGASCPLAFFAPEMSRAPSTCVLSRLQGIRAPLHPPFLSEANAFRIRLGKKATPTRPRLQTPTSERATRSLRGPIYWQRGHASVPVFFRFCESIGGAVCLQNLEFLSWNQPRGVLCYNGGKCQTMRRHEKRRSLNVLPIVAYERERERQSICISIHWARYDSSMVNGIF